MIERCHIDIESFSESDIRAVGACKYSEDLSTFLWCLSFRFGKGPKHIWLIPIGGEWPQDLVDRIIEKADSWGGFVYNGPIMPSDLRAWIEAGKPLAAFNAAFERTMLNGASGQMLNFPHTPISQWTCVAVKARAHGLPGSLGDVCKALGTTEKSESGRAVMLQVCRPKKASKADPSTMYTPASAPDKFYDLAIYNLDDVESECGVDDVVPDIPASEVEIYQIDQAINDRGVLVDLPFIDDVMFLIAERKKELEVACRKMTTSEAEPKGIAPTQRAKIADWIRVNGWPTLLDMQAETVKALLENKHVPDKVKKMLRIYSTYGLKATAKFEVMRDAACADGRIRGQFIMNGAGPGRWSAVLVQLQNLLRPVIKDPAVAKQAIKTRSLEWIRCLYPDVEPMKVFASCTRNALIAASGKKFIALDFAGIESRVGAWLADEHWKLDAFRKADAKLGPDTYTLAYSRAFQVPHEEIKKGDPRRQIGKVMELALGYEGGVGAFVTMTKTYGIKLDELVKAVLPLLSEEILEASEWLYAKSDKSVPRDQFLACDGIKRLWRQNHPRIAQLWVDIRDAMYEAVQDPGSVYSIPNKKLMFKVEGRWLYMRLPSGRRIAYVDPEIYRPKVKCDACKGDGVINAFVCEKCSGGGLIEGRPVVTYMGVDTKTRRWMRVSTYGGKGLENGDQGYSSCLLRHGMRQFEKELLTIVMHVHDELLAEVDEDWDCMGLAEECMAGRMPAHAAGLPIAVEGWENNEFRK